MVLNSTLPGWAAMVSLKDSGRASVTMLTVSCEGAGVADAAPPVAAPPPPPPPPPPPELEEPLPLLLLPELAVHALDWHVPEPPEALMAVPPEQQKPPEHAFA